MWACAGRDAVLPHCHKVQDGERGRLLAWAVWILSLGKIYTLCTKLGRGWRLILCFQVYLEKKESEAIQVLGVRDLEGHLDLQVRHEELNQPKEPVQRKRLNGLM